MRKRWRLLKRIGTNFILETEAGLVSTLRCEESVVNDGTQAGRGASLKMTIGPSEDFTNHDSTPLWDDKWRYEPHFDQEDLPRRGRIPESLGLVMSENVIRIEESCSVLYLAAKMGSGYPRILRHHRGVPTLPRSCLSKIQLN